LLQLTKLKRRPGDGLGRRVDAHEPEVGETAGASAGVPQETHAIEMRQPELLSSSSSSSSSSAHAKQRPHQTS
jgi:hypothetical protein